MTMTKTLEDCIQDADRIEIQALTKVCGQTILTMVEIPKESAAIIAAASPGDHGSDCVYRTSYGHGWTYERRSGDLVLTFKAVRRA